MERYCESFKIQIAPDHFVSCHMDNYRLLFCMNNDIVFYERLYTVLILIFIGYISLDPSLPPQLQNLYRTE